MMISEFQLEQNPKKEILLTIDINLVLLFKATGILYAVQFFTEDI